MVTSEFCGIKKIGWGWTGVIWLFNIISYLLLDPIKFAVRYVLSGKAWNLLLDRRVSKYHPSSSSLVFWMSIVDVVNMDFSFFFLNKNYYQMAFTNQKDFGKEAREAAWAAEQRTLHGLQSAETQKFTEKYNFRDINMMAEEARRRAEIARFVTVLDHKIMIIIIIAAQHKLVSSNRDN